jgi:hypothetical protein
MNMAATTAPTAKYDSLGAVSTTIPQQSPPGM